MVLFAKNSMDLCNNRMGSASALFRKMSNKIEGSQIGDVNTVLYHQDIPEAYLDSVRRERVVTWDIETSGLDWSSDRIGICQLYTLNEPIAIVKISDVRPKNLSLLLSDRAVKKVFHHAMFDLRFMSYHWKAMPQNIACTKIAAKLLNPQKDSSTSLKFLLKKYLDVEIDKNERVSDWLSEELTKEQIAYATRDVVFLLELLTCLKKELKVKGLLDLAYQCFAHIPARIQLDIRGYCDIYTY